MHAATQTVEAGIITEAEFGEFQRLIHDVAGISLAPGKKALVCGRLSKRLRELGLETYGEYLQIITGKGGRDELQTAVDLLTTNETFFFREERHFDFLAQCVGALRRPGATFRVWSAACSSGEEAYSIAMVLADAIGEAPWEVIGSDISQRVLARAQGANYPMERAKSIPAPLLHRYCLKGVGSREGTFAIEPRLRSRVQFLQVNLNARIAALGQFDVIFLRNVMIYFDALTKREVVERVNEFLRPGGYLLVSHSESLHGITEALQSVAPSIYKKPA